LNPAQVGDELHHVGDGLCCPAACLGDVSGAVVSHGRVSVLRHRRSGRTPDPAALPLLVAADDDSALGSPQGSPLGSPRDGSAAGAHPCSPQCSPMTLQRQVTLLSRRTTPLYSARRGMALHVCFAESQVCFSSEHVLRDLLSREEVSDIEQELVTHNSHWRWLVQRVEFHLPGQWHNAFRNCQVKHVCVVLQLRMSRQAPPAWALAPVAARRLARSR